MPNLHVSIRNKVARAARRDGAIVCGNNDYSVIFSFDDEWKQYAEKTARFIWNDNYFDIDFIGDTCPVPPITSAPSLEVGVYAGELRTTTAALIPCRPSVCSDTQKKIAPEAVEEYRDRAQTAAIEAKAAAASAVQALEDFRASKDSTERLADDALRTAQAATATAAEASGRTDELATQVASAIDHASEMSKHAATKHIRYAFTVGQDDERNYLTEDSSGIYSASGAFRYNDRDKVTIYRYPLTDSGAITSAVWHAHLAQQHLLQASADGETWLTLYDTAGASSGTQDHYELCGILPLAEAEALYIKIADSDTADGHGGAVLADIPVTLDLTYGATLPYLLPTVGEADEGAVLRVLGGRWRACDATTLNSRVYTYLFKVGEESEQAYLLNESNGLLNDTCRYNDGVRSTVYRYHIANAALVRRVLWTATVGQQLKLECSNDGKQWSTVYDAGSTKTAFARTTYDLTALLNLLAFDEIYIRISDSDPSDGFGGAIRMSDAVELHVERCELPIGMM